MKEMTYSKRLPIVQAWRAIEGRAKQFAEEQAKDASFVFLVIYFGGNKYFASAVYNVARHRFICLRMIAVRVKGGDYEELEEQITFTKDSVIGKTKTIVYEEKVDPT